MTTAEKLKAFDMTELFGSAPVAALHELALKTRVRPLTRGKCCSRRRLCRRSVCRRLPSLRAYRQTVEGREQTMHVEGAGATLAEAPVFDDGPYLLTIEAPTSRDREPTVLKVPTRAMWSSSTAVARAIPPISMAGGMSPPAVVESDQLVRTLTAPTHLPILGDMSEEPVIRQFD